MDSNEHNDSLPRHAGVRHGPPRTRATRWMLVAAAAATAGLLLAVAAWRQGILPARWLRTIPRPPSGHLRLALCQYGTRFDDLPWNVAHAYAYAREAFENGAEFVILPEFSFHGFAEVGRLDEVVDAFDAMDGLRPFARLARRYRGYLLVNPPMRTAEGLINESVLLGPSGGIVARYRKRLMADIDLRADFIPGRDPVAVDLPFGKVGFMICRDALDSAWLRDDGIPASNVMHACQTERLRSVSDIYTGTDLLVIQLAYAGTWTTRPNIYVRDKLTNTVGRTHEIAGDWSRLTDAYIAIVNKSGFERDYGFMGGSLVLDPQGETLVYASSGIGIVYTDLPLDADGRLRSAP